MLSRCHLGFIALSFLCYTAYVESADRPNVIYILADDLGYGDLSCYGQEKFSTPNIDRLASEGLRFTNHYSGNTVCSPSRAVLMTGLHSGHCYLRGNVAGEKNAELDPARTVLPEIFKGADYATAAFGKWGLGHTHLGGAASPLTHGFDRFFGWKSQSIAHTYYPSSVVDNDREVPLEPNTFVHDHIMDRARAFIKERVASGQPFFCYIPTAVPHAAMHAPAELHRKWRARLPEFDKRIGKYGAGPNDPCPDVINPIAGFAAMMENLDNEVGRLLALVDDLGISEDTLIMFASDNGAHQEGGHDPTFWKSTGGLRGYKRDMHEGGIRSPLLARWPGHVAAGRVSDHISGFQDMLPTFAELLGADAPEDCDGISFLPTLLGDESNQEEHTLLYFEFCKGQKQKIFSQAVRFGDWKYYRQTGQPAELFNLRVDPFEQQNLAAERSELVTQIEEMISNARTPLASQAG